MLKILLADDEYLEIEAIKYFLNQAYEEVTIVGEANNTKNLLRICQYQQPDLIFLDINLAGMDVIEVLQSLKRYNRDCMIILLGFYDDELMIEKALKYGAEDYLNKPIQQNDFLAKLKRYKNLTHSKQFLEGEQLEELLYFIQVENYRQAKEQLTKLTNEVIKNWRNIEQFKENSQVIAKSMFKIYESKKLKNIDSNQNWSISSNELTIYNFKEKLIELLDGMFEKIVLSGYSHDQNEIQAVLNYIELNYKQGITLVQAANYVHLSPHYLSKLFKKEVGMNFVGYVMERKIEKAKELLEYTDMHVIHIALELSYQEPNYFSKVFKRIVGVTPSNYRKEVEQSKRSLVKNNYVFNGKSYL
ncbi:response regulator [Salipaludibacillus daqingensis]|uniref:response regulator n=1 Tax=Salipaludibacillus daqingensis TaxID=3041001 RepID=UPI002476FC86|nr:response regulator [Salipaludibacillus daqingensis]